MNLKWTKPGTMRSMETLEKIAENLEIRESDTPPYEHPYSETIGFLDLARG